MIALKPAEVLELLDWKRRVFALYEGIRAAGAPQDAWRMWRDQRNDLFANHPQSPLPADVRRGWKGLDLFDYAPEMRVTAAVEPAEQSHLEIATSDNTTMGFTRFAAARFELLDRALTLELYWLDGYGGGLFLPFRDATSGATTYGAGRYLLDTIKGSDLGAQGDRLVLDFNFAYNPSCAYDPRWVCPLAPPPNRLDVSVTAGERVPEARARPASS
ncbi:MAG: DUF1684 domain-containing protein [Actinomycetota bacterium]